MDDGYMERRIVIGLITCTEYCKQVESFLNISWLQASAARLVATWVLDYYRNYGTAPKSEMEAIYSEKINEHIDEETAKWVEEILESLSEESQEEDINVEYLLDQTEKYLERRQIQEQTEQAQAEIDSGNQEEARKLLESYKPVQRVQSEAVIPLSDPAIIKKGFTDMADPLIRYPGAAGQVMNRALCRERAVGIMAQNKGGKTFLMMDMIWRCAEEGNQAVLFQAGDMSRDQQERRLGIYLAGKSDLPEYCGYLYIPVLDCVWNQLNECDSPERECDFGPLEGKDPEEIRGSIMDKSKKFLTASELKRTVRDNTDYVPCYRCLTNNEKGGNFLGTIWYEIRDPVSPLTWKEVYKLSKTRRYSNILKNIRLITYSNETLNMSMIDAELDRLDRVEGFQPSFIGIDYGDILAPDRDTLRMDLREQDNKKWQRARKLSQNRKALVAMGTQANAQSFEAPLLKKDHFSENRRKLDHVEAMIGINMTAAEKKKGIMRLNDIAERETEGGNVATVFNCLQMGRPFLGSYF